MGAFGSNAGAPLFVRIVSVQSVRCLEPHVDFVESINNVLHCRHVPDRCLEQPLQFDAKSIVLNREVVCVHGGLA